MGKPKFKFANLDEASLKRIRDMEETMDTYILALEPKVELAAISDEDLKRLQSLEEELGVVLLAYKK